MISAWDQTTAIAGKEITDARRTWLLLIITGFMLLAGLVALVVSALALRDDVTTYIESRDTLIALGKSAAAIAPPSFAPLKLLRGFIEYIEILGAVLGIVLGYRTAAIERGRNTLALLLTRPLSQTTLIAGKLLGNAGLIAFVLVATFVGGAIGSMLIAGVTLSGDEVLKLVSTTLAAVIYVAIFFALGLLLALHMRRLPNALLTAFALWLALVLIAPQIGDTLDPDNQVAGGVFRTLGIAKPQEKEILKSFAVYETLRDDIEQASPAKHFERWSFAMAGIKEVYNGQPILGVMAERQWDLEWLAGVLAALLGLLFLRPLNYSRLTKE
jgi:ABC-type transport system involved in multi-copper enzyme maturation permease subunit